MMFTLRPMLTTAHLTAHTSPESEGTLIKRESILGMAVTTMSHLISVSLIITRIYHC